ncbi:MAG: DUF6356 family protein [Pseudomonadota bacterium]|jgi:hypothetical protein|uniref:Uncharacterized protein n=1 Tax=hydrothermal vent metagenome TaxID=652676 RepID=A0A160TG79_9ZZZZ|nr:DUF6356 family protein [Sphingomonas sp.]WEJ97976.1 MAG: DUF6356 family protein [Sphingomonas sp.]
MFRRLFLDHPKSVGESYTEHFGVASHFGLKMMWGGARCTLHAVLPFMFKTAGSDTITVLHAELVTKRNAARAEQTQITTVEYVI